MPRPLLLITVIFVVVTLAAFNVPLSVSIFVVWLILVAFVLLDFKLWRDRTRIDRFRRKLAIRNPDLSQATKPPDDRQ